jgi:hypothetical protein
VSEGGEGSVLSAIRIWKSANFSRIDIDGGVAEVLAKTLSLNGKLFEIYFVRLIGTPNQQFKNDTGFGQYHVSSS